MWWTHPSWKQQCCADCGVNIWDAGGDPDHGVCYECFMVRWDQEHQPSDISGEFDMADDTCPEAPTLCMEPALGPLLRHAFHLMELLEGIWGAQAAWKQLAPAGMERCSFTDWYDCSEWRDESDIPF